MAERRLPMTDDELGDALTRLGAELDYPAPGELTARVRRRLETEVVRPRRSWRDIVGWRPEQRPLERLAWRPFAVAAALVLLLFAGSLAAFPSVREAVADWLGLRGIVISVVPSLSPIPSAHADLDLGAAVTLDDARAGVGWTVLVPADPRLGSPDEVYLDRRIRDGVVSLVWGARPGLPAASSTGAGLLLTEFRGSIVERLFQKFVGPGTTVERVRVDGRLGYWIAGAPHEIVLVDRFGEPIAETLRLSGNVLMWEDGELTLRVELAGTKDDALRIAASVR